MVLTLTTLFIPSTKVSSSPSTINRRSKLQSFQRGTIVCRKEGVHPEFHEDARVYCNGELVMTTGGTQREYSVDVWSGNHPFYLGNRSAVLFDADQVEKFRKKYSGLTSIMEIPTLRHGEIILPQRKKSAKGKGKK